MSKPAPLSLRKPIREHLRKRGEPMAQDIRLQERDDGVVRMSLMKAAHEQYDDVPSKVTQWYDPVEHAVIIPLPEPEDRDEWAQSLDTF